MYILLESIVFLFVFVIIINYSTNDTGLVCCHYPCLEARIYVIRMSPEVSVSGQQAFFPGSNQLVLAICICVVAPMKQSIHCPQKQKKLCLG